MLRANVVDVEDLTQPGPPADADSNFVTAEWPGPWPCEEAGGPTALRAGTAS